MSQYLINSFSVVPTCTEDTYIDLPSESLVNRTLSTNSNRLGIGFRPDSGHALFEKKIKSVTVKLNDDGGSPSQTIYSRVRNSSGSVVDTFGSIDASTLDGTPTEYTFEGTEITLSSGDFITLEYNYSNPQISAAVYRTGTDNYISNASTLASTSSITSWAEYYDFDYFWLWIKVVYCS